MSAWRFEFEGGDVLIGWGESWHDALEDIPASRWDGVIGYSRVSGRMAMGCCPIPEGWR